MGHLSWSYDYATARQFTSELLKITRLDIDEFNITDAVDNMDYS